MYSIRAKHSREPEFKDLITYVDKETAVVSDALFSKEAVEQYLVKRDVKVNKRSHDKCVMCTACHDLDDCCIFMSLTVED